MSFIVLCRFDYNSIALNGWQRLNQPLATLFYYTTNRHISMWKLKLFYVNKFGIDTEEIYKILSKHSLNVINKITHDGVHEYLNLDEESIFRLRLMGSEERDLLLN